MDIARDICTDSFYIVNSGLPCIAETAVLDVPLSSVCCPLASPSHPSFHHHYVIICHL